MTNKPLTKNVVRNLPLGFNITGFYPNRRMRRSLLQPNYSTKKVQNVMGGFDEGGIQIKPMWIKTPPRHGSLKPSWFANGHWELNPLIVSIHHINTIKHVNN